MNVEALSTEKGVNFARKFINAHKTLMAIDESTTIKSPTLKPFCSNHVIAKEVSLSYSPSSSAVAS